MATMNLRVRSGVVPSQNPFIVSNDNTNCEHIRVITVPVPVGQTRYVTLTHTGVGANAANDVAETINTDTNYTLQIDGNIDNGTPSNNDEYAIVVFTVALSNSDPIYYSNFIDRQHTGNFC